MDTVALQKKANQLRKDIVQMIGPCKVGHLGGSCSLADIVTVLYYDIMRLDPQNPAWPQRDRFLLSKGHAALIQYAALGDLGYFPKEEEKTLKTLGSRLQGHPDMCRLPGIEANTGSLGQGLSIAAGMAAGLRLDKIDARVYCCLGDGELAEGQVWEAAMAAGIFRLNNLTAIVDVNGLQATGTVENRFDSQPYLEKFEAFRWNVIEVDGHDIGQLKTAFQQAIGEKEKPTVLLAKTIKGKGFDFAENVVAFHNGQMTQEQFDKAMQC
ncbi:MAG: transketolase [Clostridiales bacterium]|nr:transketolase [Clostridiales bacterium]